MATLLKKLEHAEPAPHELDRWIDARERKSLLRFIACGSVDDGKSTLIGRLLYEARQVFDDQLEELESDSKRHGTTSGAIDFALLVDGLSAEREQGITIDVAYRYFSTRRRKFIVADTPGHEQYTRNMVTGASTADLAIILVDARKGVLTQTRRHSYLARLVGIRRFVLAVNKMDLVDYNPSLFDAIRREFGELAAQIDIDDWTAIPVSGLKGDNVTSGSKAMPWYEGPSLLDHLDTVPITAAGDAARPFRMAVQWVNRPGHDFRGYSGRIASGQIHPGDEVVLLPSGQRSKIERIVTMPGPSRAAGPSSPGDLSCAIAGQSVTVTLADHIDCSRGDLLASALSPAPITRKLRATLIWMNDEPLDRARSYWLKTGTRTVSARIEALHSIVDISTFAEGDGAHVKLNDIARVTFDLDRPIAAELYDDCRRLGSFLIIDKQTNESAGAGLIQDMEDWPGKDLRARPSAPRILWVKGRARDEWAQAAAERLQVEGRAAFVLDESKLRQFPADDEITIARRLALMMAEAGVHVFITLDVSEAEAAPGRLVDCDLESDGGEWWVI